MASSSVPTTTATSSLKRGEERQKLNLKVGDELHGYKVKEVTPIPERNLTAILLVHQATGAEHLHIDCADTNNTFSVLFKTIPRDSSGVAHILEHTTLCGSKKYPVRDPFFNMIKRSLNTYMNAWTGSDYTGYPFSTQNEKDFSNLLSVYLDATFFPNLDKIDFMQEGHRLEFENPDDLNSRVTFKGVVYNEMKGSMSDSSNFFSHRLSEQLFPGTTYANNSGGEPKDIPNLTYEQLKEFHRVHYHPSNARFITYGDLPLEGHLKFITENALSKFNKIDPKTDVNDVPRFTTPKTIELTCPPPPMDSDSDKQTKVSVAVVCNKIQDSLETFYMSILSTLLLDGPNSPMYKSLIDSNIGNSYAPSTGYDHHSKEGSFGIGLQGIRKEDVNKVVEIIDATLQKAAKEGFEPERIESILHQLEISNKHVTTNFGLQIVSGITSYWIHGANPIEVLQFNSYIERLKADLKAKPLFQDLIKKYFLNNPHRVTLVMNPDPDFVQKESKEEEVRLAAIQNKLTNQKKQEIVALQQELKTRQEMKQDISVLPTLTLADIPKTTQKTETIKKKSKGIDITWVPQPTNGLVYYRGLIPIPDIPKDLLLYLPLFTSLLSRIGTEKRDYRQLAHQTDLYTGGISTSTHLINSPTDLQELQGYLFCYASALERNVVPMFELLQDILTNPKWTEKDFIKSNIMQRMASMQDSLISDGHSYASSYAAAPFRRLNSLNETFGGITQFNFMTKLAEMEDLTEVIGKLQELAKIILQNGVARCMINAEEKHFSKIEQQLDGFLSSLPSAKPSSNIGDIKETSNSVKTFFSVPGSVNFLAKCMPTVPYTHPDSPKLQIMARLVGRNFLHTEIREKGGAYGGGASSSSGLFQFYSYRDPNVQRTLDTFNKSLDWVKAGTFTDQDINEAKLTVFADLDAPTPPSDKGTLEFSLGITHEMRQQRRERFFAIARKDLIEVAEKYLNQPASIACVGGEQFVESIRNDKTWEIKE